MAKSKKNEAAKPGVTNETAAPVNTGDSVTALDPTSTRLDPSTPAADPSPETIIEDDEDVDLGTPGRIGADEETSKPPVETTPVVLPPVTDTKVTVIQGTLVTDAPFAGLGEGIQMPGSGAPPIISHYPEGLIAVELDVPYLPAIGYAGRDMTIEPKDAETLRDIAAGLRATNVTLEGRTIDTPRKALEWLLAGVRANVARRGAAK